MIFNSTSIVSWVHSYIMEPPKTDPYAAIDLVHIQPSGVGTKMGSFWWWDSERSSSIQGFWPLSAKKKHWLWIVAPWPWGIHTMFANASILQLGTGTSVVDLMIRSQTSYDFDKHVAKVWSINTVLFSLIPQPSLGLPMFEGLRCWCNL